MKKIFCEVAVCVLLGYWMLLGLSFPGLENGWSWIFYLLLFAAPIAMRKKLWPYCTAGAILFLTPWVMSCFGYGNWIPGAEFVPNARLRAQILLMFPEIILMITLQMISMRGADRGKEIFWNVALSYLLSGFVFADAYFLLGFSGTAFRMESGFFAPSMREALYFSFTTLTTTGFGDIAPVMPLACQLAMLEAVFGVLYGGLFVAKIVNAGKNGKNGKN